MPTSSIQLNVSWQLPEPELRNGVVVSFTLRYWRDENDPRVASDAVTSCTDGVCEETVLAENGHTSATVYSATIAGLEKFVRYNVSVVANTAVGEGAVLSRTLQRTQATTPSAAPTNVSITLTATSATIVVQPPPAAAQNGIVRGYFVRTLLEASGAYAGRGDADIATPLDTYFGSLTEAQGLALAPTTIDLLGLQSYMRYTVIISAYTCLGDTPCSAGRLLGQDLQLSIETQQAPPAAAPSAVTPSNAAAVTTLRKAVDLVISLPPAPKRNGVITGYNVTYYDDDDNLGPARTQGVHSVTFDVDAAPKRVTDLFAYVNYVFEVRAMTAAGLGEAVRTSQIRTLPDAPTGPVTNPTGSSGTPSTVAVTWERPDPWKRNGPLEGYRLTLRQLPDVYADASPDITTEIDSRLVAEDALESTFEAQFSSLAAFVQFEVEILPQITGQGTGDASETRVIIPIQTRASIPDGAVLGLNIDSPQSDMLTLAWAEPLFRNRNGELVDYHITYTRQRYEYVDGRGGSVSTRAAGSAITVTSNNATSFTIATLESYTQYRVELTPENTAGLGSAASRVQAIVRTAPAVPRTQDIPRLLVDETLPSGFSKESAVSVSWDHAGTLNGVVRRLIVVVEPASTATHGQSSFRCDAIDATCKFGAYNKNERKTRAWIAYEATFAEGDNKLLTGGSVVIGDAETYGTYVNGPLASGSSYTFRLIVFTSASDVELGRTSDPTPLTSTASPPASSPAAAIAAAIVVVIVVIIIAAVLYRRRQRRKKPELFPSSAGAPDNFAMNTLASSRTTTTFVSKPNGGGGGGLTLTNGGAAASSTGFGVATSAFSPSSGALPQVGRGGASQPQVVPSMAPLAGAQVDPNGPQLPPVERHEVAVQDLPNVILQMSANDDFAFSEEYECIEGPDAHKGITKNFSLSDANRMKNRYANILAYDYTRVALSRLPGDPNSDYINANYIDGYDTPRYYIAAQGPLPHTVIDFWRMIWEQSVTTVVMVTNLEEKSRVKCHRYWPAGLGETFQLTTNMKVVLEQQEDFPDFVIRHLQVHLGQQVRSVYQYHYVSWPDHGVPDSTSGTLSMLRKAKAERNKPGAGPMVVHCSAGVGRTGTLIAVDYNMDKAARENKVRGDEERGGGKTIMD